MPVASLSLLVFLMSSALVTTTDRWTPAFITDPLACENSEIDAYFDTTKSKLIYHNVAGPTNAVQLPPDATLSIIGSCKPGEYTYAELVLHGRLFGQNFSKIHLPVDPDCQPGLAYEVYFDASVKELQTYIKKRYGSELPFHKAPLDHVIVETSYIREDSGKAVYVCSLNEFD